MSKGVTMIEICETLKISKRKARELGLKSTGVAESTGAPGRKPFLYSLSEAKAALKAAQAAAK